MRNATVRANARTLPEATDRPDAALVALAEKFEAAFQAQRPFFYGSGTDEEADAATARVDEIARKIVALPTADIEMMRLKARIYLWSEGTDFKSFAAQNEGDGSSEAVLVSLFRDLGADRAPDPIFAAIARHSVARDALIEAIPRADKVTAKREGREVPDGFQPSFRASCPFHNKGVGHGFGLGVAVRLDNGLAGTLGTIDSFGWTGMATTFLLDRPGGKVGSPLFRAASAAR